MELTPRAFELLKVLLENRPRALDKDFLRDRLWPDTAVGDTSLAKLVSELRQAIGDDPREPRLIRTLHRFGYAFRGEAVEEAATAVERGPYPGLEPFTGSEAALFFGREAEVGALWEKLGRRRLLAVTGRAGVGKTSFLRAGVVPARPEGWAAAVCTPGSSPLRRLGQAVALPPADDPGAAQEPLRVEDEEAIVRAATRWRGAHAEALLVVDQYEEVFTLSPPRAQEACAAVLGRLVSEAGLHVLICLRDDFLQRCHGHEALAPVFEALTPLGPPDREALRRALVEPARSRGYRFEDDALVEEMLASVDGDRAALPRLASAAAQLWERRDRDRRLLTRGAYEAMGGVWGALAPHAEAAAEPPAAAGPGPDAPGTAASGRRRWWLRVAGLAAAAMTGALVLALLLRPSSPEPSRPRRLTLAPPAGVTLPRWTVGLQHLAISPDGRRIAFGEWHQGVEYRLHLQAIDDLEARPLGGGMTPFFSPDGAWLAFERGRSLWKKRLDSDAGPIEIAVLPERARELRGAGWGADGTIVFAPCCEGGLWGVSAEGGQPRVLTKLDLRTERSHRWPQVLPDGRHVLFSVFPKGGWRDSGLALLSLDTGRWRPIARATGYGRYSPTGHLVFARLGTLFAAPFDAARTEMVGPGVPVLDDVQMEMETHYYASFELSANGSLLYTPGFPRPVARSLLMVGREGRTHPLGGPRRAYTKPRISPDGRSLVALVEEDSATKHLWRLELETGASARLSSEAVVRSMAWSPDGRWLAFASTTGFMRLAADGRAPAEWIADLPAGMDVSVEAWTPDGRALVFQVWDSQTLFDIGILPLETRVPRLLLPDPHRQHSPVVSPDGRFLAYATDESGRSDIVVVPFPDPRGEKHVVSTDGGMEPCWSPDGRELFYRDRGDVPKLMAVEVETRGPFRAGRPRPLLDDRFDFPFPLWGAAYDAAPEGRGFVFVEKPPGPRSPTRLVLVPGWAAELRARVR